MTQIPKEAPPYAQVHGCPLRPIPPYRAAPARCFSPPRPSSGASQRLRRRPPAQVSAMLGGMTIMRDQLFAKGKAGLAVRPDPRLATPLPLFQTTPACRLSDRHRVIATTNGATPATFSAHGSTTGSPPRFVALRSPSRWLHAGARGRQASRGLVQDALSAPHPPIGRIARSESALHPPRDVPVTDPARRGDCCKIIDDQLLLLQPYNGRYARVHGQCFILHPSSSDQSDSALLPRINF